MPIPAITSAGSVVPVGVGKTPEEKAALGFDTQLPTHLTDQLARSAMPQDDEASAATNSYRDMLPGALAVAIVAAGGVGLAANLVTKEQCT